MFENKDWLKELIVILALYIAAVAGIDYIVKSVLSVPLSVAVVTLIVYRLHRRSAAKSAWRP